MSLIDETYFVGDLVIPNANSTNQAGVAVLERLTWFIEKYEPIFLKDLLGYDLWKLVDTQITQEEENSPATPLPRLDRIINGYEYTGQNAKVYKWRGLIFTEGTTKQSMIANYVYWHWLKDQVSQTVGLGESATQAQNATLVSPTIKMNRAWDEISRQAMELNYFLQSNQTDYPEWVLNYNRIASLRFLAPQNQFGI